MRRATYTLAAYTGEIEISIHALHEESDGATVPGSVVISKHFNPRSP